MARWRWRPRWGKRGWLLTGLAVLALYLAALSAIPALIGGSDGADRERARRALAAENWALVVPEDRAELAAAIDQSWRALRGYQMVYRAGTPADLAADTPVVTATTVVTIGADGRVRTQHDTNLITARAPGSQGRDQRFEGYRILSDQPFVNGKNRRIGDTEQVYQQQAGGQWTCQRVLADDRPIPAPALRLAEGGDAGFAEIDGHRVRGFSLPAGAFGLRSPATIWVDVESLLVRRQEIDSAVRGQREIWTYGRFNESPAIFPPAGVRCQDD